MTSEQSNQITITKDTADTCLGAIGIALNAMTADGPPSGADANAAMQVMLTAQTELMQALRSETR